MKRGGQSSTNCDEDDTPMDAFWSPVLAVHESRAWNFGKTITDSREKSECDESDVVSSNLRKGAGANTANHIVDTIEHKHALEHVPQDLLQRILEEMFTKRSIDYRPGHTERVRVGGAAPRLHRAVF